MHRRVRLSLVTIAALVGALAVPATPAWAEEPPPAPVESEAVEPGQPLPPEQPAAEPPADDPVAAALSFGSRFVTFTKSSAIPPVVTAAVSGSPLPSGTTVKWTWTRQLAGTVVSTSKTYTPGSADQGLTLVARAVLTKSGYAPLTIQQVFTDHWISASGPATLSGTPSLAQQLTCVAPTRFANSDDTDIVPTPTYAWYRGTTKIGGADASDSTYTLTAADVGATVECRQVWRSAGYVPLTLAVSTAAPIPPAVFGGSPSASIIGPFSRGLQVGASGWIDPLPELGSPTVSWQWLRDGIPIAGATGPTYTLQTADNRTRTAVRVTVSKPGFTSIVLQPSALAAMQATATPAISGDVRVGGEVEGTAPAFYADGPTSTIQSRQWLRDGVPISGAIGTRYTITSADKGHALSFRVAATETNRPTIAVTSPPTQKVGGSAFTDSGSGVLLLSCCINGKLEVASTGLSPAGTATYQWLRNGSPISGATGKSYTLTAADRGTSTSVRVRTTKSGYTTVVQFSQARDYSIVAAAAPTLVQEHSISQVADQLSVALPVYSSSSGSVSPTMKYQWLRNGSAISGATGATYVIRSGDLGARISVRVTASASGLNSLASTTAATATVVKGVLQVGTTPPLVTNSAGVLTAAIPSGAITTREVTLAYQWYRQAGSAAPVKIGGATSKSYRLTSADSDRTVFVRVTVKKANVVPTSQVMTDSTGRDYTIKNTVAPTVGGTNAVGATLTANPGSYTALGSPFTPNLSYQWYRGGSAITGATASTYTLVAADRSKAVTVRVTARLAGLLPRTSTAAPTPAVTQLGTLAFIGVPAPHVTIGSIPNQIRASIINGAPTTPGTKISYQWYRAGAAITGATSSTYLLRSTDRATMYSVRITISATGYVSWQQTSAQRTWGVHATTSDIQAFGSAFVGRGYILIPPTWQYDDGDTATPTRRYVWYRDDIPIPGATASSYTFVAADYGRTISVTEFVTGPGIVPASLSTTFPEVGLGTNNPDRNGTALMTMNPATNTLTASLEPGSLLPAAPAPKLTYQWFRVSSGVETAIPGATKSTYKLADGPDYRKSIFVRITVHRDRFEPAYTGYPLDSVARDFTSLPGPQVSFATTPKFGTPLVAPTQTWVDSSDQVITSQMAVTYRWYRSPPSDPHALTLISGATGSSYTPTAADLGMLLTVGYSATIPGYLRPPHPSSAPSAPVQALNLAWDGGTYPLITTTPTSLTLKVTPPPASAFGIAPTSITYQWTRKLPGHVATLIPGATSSSYTLTQADFDASINVLVTARRTGYSPVVLSATSGVDRSLRYTTSAGVTPSTGVTTGTLLMATNPTLSPNLDGVTFTYQWYRGAGIAISGATQPSYRVAAADVGKPVYVIVAWKRPGWLATFIGSPTTDPVSTAPILGSVPLEVGYDFGVNAYRATYSTSGITTPGVTFTGQWYRNGTIVTGATAVTYKPSSAARIGTWRYVLTMTKAGYTTRTVMDEYTYT